MPETITIDERTARRLERVLNRVDIKLDREELAETVTEEQAAEFLGMKITSFRNRILDGTIPANAIVEMVNGKRRYKLHKLVK